MQGAEDVGVGRRLKVNNAKRRHACRGAGVRMCVRGFNYTQGEDPGCFFRC